MKLPEFFKPVIIGLLVLALIFGALFLFGRWYLDEHILPQKTGDVPKEGLWYCEEMEMYLSFTHEYKSTVVIDGETRNCTWGCEIGCSDIHITCLDENGVLRESLLWGEYVSLTEERYQIRNHETGEIYDFIRVK
jgi:hypothetical protein